MSALFGLVVVVLCLTFGAFVIRRLGITLNTFGIALTALVCAVAAPIAIVTSLAELAGADLPATFDVAGTVGVVAVALWWGALMVRGRPLVRSMRGWR